MSKALDQANVAALSASCIAAAVSLVIAPGTYDLFSVIISLTLASIIFGSIGFERRSFLPRLAVAAGVALSMLPLSGFILEIAAAPPCYQVAMATGSWAPRCYELGYTCVGDVAPSKVEGWQQFLAWGFWLGATFWFLGRRANPPTAAPASSD